MAGLGAVLGATAWISACTGTDTLDTGNQLVTIELVVEGNTQQAWQCRVLTVQQIAVRPLDGQCSAGSTNPGEPCLSPVDCPGGSCEGSQAALTVPESGIALKAALDTIVDLDGKVCAPTVGACGIDESVACSSAHPCTTAQGKCFPSQTGLAFRAQPFEVPGTVLTSGLYEVSQLFAAKPGFYSEDPDALTFSYMGDCNPTPTDLAPALGKPRFFFDATQSNVIQVVVNLAALESAMGPPCDFEGQVQSIISIE
jgi:hypothetical protein